MQCAILIGGRGTRLGELVQNSPKPMLPVAGRPFLAYLIENLARFGFEEFLLLSGYRSEVVQSFLEGRPEIAERFRLRIRVVAEPEARGTAGALHHARDLLAPEFLLINGDSIFDFNVLDLMTCPMPEPWLARMALRHVPDGSRYGVVSLASSHTVTEMSERGSAGPAVINGGVYWLRREIVDAIPAGECSLERTIFPAIARRGLLRGKVYDGFFLDIGVPEDFHASHALMGARRRPAVFFDRDGVLNHDDGYTHRSADFSWNEGAIAAIRLVNDCGWYAFVVTNQSGVARGFYSEEDVVRLHQWMNQQLRPMGAHIDDFRYCPYHSEGTVMRYAMASDWRKPGPGMVLDLIKAWPVDPANSVLIGDKDIDMEAARRAGVRGRLYPGGDLAALVQEELGGSIGAGAARLRPGCLNRDM
jgi:D,D-heptose 1,7-bisphosphate phosphatase